MKKKMVIVSIIGLLILGGGGASAYFFVLKGNSAENATLAEGEIAEDQKPEDLPPAMFMNLPPVMVNANYEGRLRYLQVKLAAMTRDEDTLENLEANTPLIQDSMILLLGSYEFDYLVTSEGKEELRTKAEEKIRELISDDGLESVLYTGFVIQ